MLLTTPKGIITLYIVSFILLRQDLYGACGKGGKLPTKPLLLFLLSPTQMNYIFQSPLQSGVTRCSHSHTGGLWHAFPPSVFQVWSQQEPPWKDGVRMVCVCVCLVAQSCLTLCNPMDCSLPGSSAQEDSPGKNCWSGLPFPSPRDLPNPGF